MTQHITDNIFRMEIPLPGNPLKVINSYFIRGEGRNLLIDTGFNMPECRAALMDGLAELQVDLASTDLYITHFHSDHIGLAPEILQPGCKIYLSEVDEAILRGNAAGFRWDTYDELYLREGMTPGELELLARKNPARIYAPAELPEFTTVRDGDVLEYGGHRLEVLVVPGHTPGNTVLYLREKKLMFLGDHVLFNITPNIIAWLELENALKQYCDNLRRVREYDVEIPLPAHRAVTCTMQERIDQILAHHRRRLAEAVEIVREHPGSNACQIAARMTWNIRTSSNRWEDFPIGQKWFAVGEVLSHMEYLMAEGRVLRRTEDGRSSYWLA